MKVLVTGAMQAAAYQLKAKLIEHEVILGDFVDIPSPMLKAGTLLALPKPTDPAYMHLMLALCLDTGIEKIYTLNQSEFDGLNNAKLLFEEYGITIAAANNEI